MSFVIPDPRWEEPALLVPGLKPTGPVVIDWGHPLARGLISCQLCDSMHRGDLVSGAVIDLDTDGEYGANYLEHTPIGDLPIVSTNTVMQAPVTGLSSFSIYTPLGLATRQNIWSGGKVTLTHGYSTSSRVFAYIYTTNCAYIAEAHTGFFVQDEKINVGLSWNDVDTEGAFYKNGESYSMTPFSTGSGQAGEVRLLSDGEVTATNKGNGRLECNFVWNNRVLTADEHASLSRNPYQFLCPQ